MGLFSDPLRSPTFWYRLYRHLFWVPIQVAGCYVMHQSLQDPEVRFPQISELAVGPTAAKMLYRRELGGNRFLEKPSRVVFVQVEQTTKKHGENW